MIIYNHYNGLYLKIVMTIYEVLIKSEWAQEIINRIVDKKFDK